MSDPRDDKGPARDSTRGPGPRPTSYLADVGQSLRGAVSNAWMVTFTDLVALMLTFFVLLFSMSVVERYKWQNLVRSLAGNMDSLQSREGPKPALEFQIDQMQPPPGTDLDYLTPVIEQQLAAEPALAAGLVWRKEGKTMITLPAERLFEPDGREISPRARTMVYTLSRLLQTLDNRIEVHGHGARRGGPGGEVGAWDVSLARAAALAEALTATGYKGKIAVRGYAATRQGEADLPVRGREAAPYAERIDIVILNDASRS